MPHKKSLIFLLILFLAIDTQADLIRVGEDFMPTLDNPTGVLPVELPNPQRPEVTVSGQVVQRRADGAESVIAGKTVVLWDEASGQMHSTVTGADGGFRFSIPWDRITQYTVGVAAPAGYTPGRWLGQIGQVDYFVADTFTFNQRFIFDEINRAPEYKVKTGLELIIERWFR